MKKLMIALLVVTLLVTAGLLMVHAAQPEAQASEAVYCEKCDQEFLPEAWQEWDFTEGEVPGGHYRLTDDFYDQTNTVTIASGTKVCLDLQGKVYSTENIRPFFVNGTLSIMDSVGGGMILTTGANTTNNAGAFAYVEKTGELHLYGGTVQFVEREEITISTGGMVYVNKGAFNIYGGTLRGGVISPNGGSAAQGGNIFVNAGKLNITGGTVTGGKVLQGDTTYAAQGGNIYALSSAQISISGDAVVSDGYSEQDGGNIYIASAYLNLSGDAVIKGGHADRSGGNIHQKSTSANGITITGGKITGGVAAGALADLSSGSTTARSGGGGGNMYVSSAAGTLTISGGEITGDIRVDNVKEMTLSGAPKIGMGKSNGLMFVNGMKADVSGLTEGAEIYVWAQAAFTKDLDDETAATAASAYFKGVIRTVVAVDGLALKGTQGTSGTEGYCPHCGSKVAWYAGFAATANQVHRYLTQNDIGTTANKTISQDVVLDLNGFAYQRTTGRILFSTASKSLSVLDSYGGGRIESTGAGNSSSGFVYVYSANTTLNLYSGTLKRNVGTATSVVVKGGVVQVGISSAKMNVYGGVITGGIITGTADGGGNIYLANGAKLTMEAGIIKDGNAAAGLGGNIYSKGGADSIEIRGGFILNGTTTGSGGNIYSLGKVNMSGGTVAYGSAGNGGNLYGTGINTVSGGVIVGGTATNGGNIYNAAGTLSVTNARVLCGTAITGGNIYVDGSAVNINSGAMVLGGVSNGTASTNSGGNIRAAGAATVTVDGGTLATGSTLQRGGNVYLSGAGTFTLKNDGKIFGGSATVCGGNIATNQNSATINLESGLVTDGTSATGPNVCLYNCTATLNIGNATVTGGVYGGKGVVNLSGNARVVNKNGTYANNIAFLADGKLYVSNDFTGEASVSLGGSYSNGEALPDTKGQCGIFNDDGTFEATGSYTGKLVYESESTKPWILGVDGSLVIGTTQLIAKDGTNVWYTSNASAVSSYDANNTGYLKLMTADDLVLDGGTYVVDLAGQSVKITGTGTVALADSANNTYDVDACGTATIDGPSLAESPLAEAGDKQYIRLLDEENGSYSSHRLDMRVNGVSIRPSVAGVYYTCVWSCDDLLKEKIKSFGVAVSTKDMPADDFMSDGNTLWTSIAAESFVSGETKNSVLIQNILKKNNANNDTRGKTEIFAAPYLILNDGTESGIALVASKETAYSLYSAMDTMDGMIAKDPTNYRRLTLPLRSFWERWKEDGMQTWDFEKIPTPAEDDVIDVLMLGSSFCYYYVEELYGLAEAAGVKMRVCNLYYSGCKFTQQYTWWVGGNNPHEFYEVVDNTGRKKTTGVSLEWALAQGDWDVISIQESTSTILGAGAQAHLDATREMRAELIGYLQEQFPKAKTYWHQPWTHQLGYKGTTLVIDSFEKQQKRIMTIREFALGVCEENNMGRVNTGEAWQLFRYNYVHGTGEFEDTLCARLGVSSFDGTAHSGDGYHDGDIGGGQYLNACVWFETLMNDLRPGEGYTCVGNTYNPVYGENYSLTQELRTALQLSAHQAVAERDDEVPTVVTYPTT